MDRKMLEFRMLDVFISSLQLEILASDVAIVLSCYKKRERGREGRPMLSDAGAVLAGYTGVIIPHAKTTPGGNERTSPT